MRHTQVATGLGVLLGMLGLVWPGQCGDEEHRHAGGLQRHVSGQQGRDWRLYQLRPGRGPLQADAEEGLGVYALGLL